MQDPDARTRAQAAIEDYIVNRGGKVRDHSYGRDRFDAFMKGLGEIMTPERFIETCNKVNRERERNGQPTINGADYLPTPEKKEAFTKLANKAERAQQVIEQKAAEFKQRTGEKAGFGFAIPDTPIDKMSKESVEKLRHHRTTINSYARA